MNISPQSFFKYISNNLHPDVNSYVTLIDGDGKHESSDDITNCFLREFSNNFNSGVSHSARIQLLPVKVERSILREMINFIEYSVGRVMQEQKSAPPSMEYHVFFTEELPVL